MSILDSKYKIIPAAYALLLRGNDALLLRRANTGYADGKYGLPAGHVEEDETALAAAAREAKEEIGLDIPLENFRFVHVMHSKSFDPEKHERVSFFFEVTKWKGEPYNAEPGKCDELRWAKLTDLPAEMSPEVRHALEKISAGEMYSDYNF